MRSVKTLSAPVRRDGAIEYGDMGSAKAHYWLILIVELAVRDVHYPDIS
jgi:hypothetical protein